MFEAKQRMYGGGNLFSNNHRSPNLPDSCAMIDIDRVSIKAGKIDAIIEDKFKFDSVTLGNPMAGSGTWQRSKLLDICSLLACPLILQETSTNTTIKFIGDKSEKIDNLSEFNIIDTADRIYVEIRWGKPKAIIYRTEGVKMVDLQNDEVFKVVNILKETIGLDFYLVNDIRPESKIYIKKYGDALTHVIEPNISSSWVDVYKKIGLL
jgi:hypothetical protein